MAPGNSRLFGTDENARATGLEAIEIPVMLMTASRDRSNSNEADGTPIWDALRGPHHRRINFVDGGHYLHQHLPDLGALGVDDGCGDSFIKPKQLMPSS